MLTGYLLLDREYDLHSTKMFYKKNLLPLVITWEIWVLFYNIFLCFYRHTEFGIKSFLKELLFLKKVDLPHTWYVPMIVGMYLFIPFVSMVLKKIDWKIIVFLLAIVFVCFFVVPSANLLKLAQQASTPHQYISQLNLYYSGGTYGLYFVCGYCLKKWKDWIKRLYQNKITYVVSAMFSLILYSMLAAGDINHSGLT